VCRPPLIWTLLRTIPAVCGDSCFWRGGIESSLDARTARP
jgi:hypothetical protein